ncbi:hypothetical protein MT355_20965 [Rathayibacter sp. VKM Ac-2929]|uniref:hypothetical protein n=1 Tax=Rathayibacter sp. VKM Ac-2929 TaxID=2929480 RepID=UPI001FB1B798|nr:hypothetical protein [Rathayibacter sp. VKM Ac-2929]MCJ1675747.1 hypothetical protein [Rathayibacter sp. VKM Ac-2929]
MGKASRRKSDVDRAAKVAQRLEQTRFWHEQRANDGSLPKEQRLDHLLNAGMPDDRPVLEEVREVGRRLLDLGWTVSDVGDVIAWEAPVHEDDLDLLDAEPGADDLSAAVEVDLVGSGQLYTLALPRYRSTDIATAQRYFTDVDALITASSAASSLRPGDDLSPFWPAFPAALTRAEAEQVERDRLITEARGTADPQR